MVSGRYVIDALRTLDARGVDVVDVRADVQQRYNARLHERMRRTVWLTGGCASWYLDRRGRNTTLGPGSTLSFRALTRRFDADAYRFAASAGAPRREAGEEHAAAG